MTEQSESTRWKAASAVLAVLLVAAVVAICVLVATDDDPVVGGAASAPSAQVLLDAERDADAAARAAAVSLTTYDYLSLEKDFAWAADSATKKFQQQYAEVSKPIRALVLKLQAHAEGSVVDSAAHAIDADHVDVLLFVDQTLTNKKDDERKLDQPRMTMQMVRQDGRWLLDEVKLSNLTEN